MCRGLFVGGKADAKDWWEELLTKGSIHPLKTFAIQIFMIVPHAAEVEWLFSNLGGLQGVKHCNLTVENFEKLGKLQNHYSYHLQQHNKSLGKSTGRKHGHMHTRVEPGIDVDLTSDLNSNFTWSSPLAVVTPAGSDIDTSGPESISVDELDKAFEELKTHTVIDPSLVDGSEVLEGQVYDLDEMEKVDDGIAPTGFQDDVQELSGGSEADNTWSIDTPL